MTRSGNYLVRHGTGFKFQMAVPRDLRDIVGRRMWRRYLPNMLEPEARLAALALALDCRREIERLRALALARDGPHAPGRTSVPRPMLPQGHARTAAGHPRPAIPLGLPLPRRLWEAAPYRSGGGPFEPASPADFGAGAAGMLPMVGALLAGACRLNDNAPVAEPGPTHRPEAMAGNTGDAGGAQEASVPTAAPQRPRPLPPDEPAAPGDDGGPLGSLTDLVGLWQTVARPRAKRSQLRMMTCANLLAEAIGPVPPHTVTRADVMRFRDHLETTELARSTARLYLQGVHRLFAIAVSEGCVAENPAAGVALRPGTDKFADRDRRRPFGPDEIRAVLGALDCEPVAFRWIVRLLAWHGMRSGEAVQLHADDITTLFGVPVLRIHDRHGSLKNRFSRRDVPLHPACAGFVDYVHAQGPGRIFAADEWRADRFQRYAGVFLRKRVRLTDSSVTMHSLRHTWRTLAREIAMPAPVSRAIMGHSMGSDVHEGYGSGPSLRQKAEWMQRIDPFALDADA